MFCKTFKTNLTLSQWLEKHEKQVSNTDFSHICLPMYLLSPTILGCALSSSRFSWFADAPLIAKNPWLCLIVFAFQLVCPCTPYRQQLLAAPSRLRVSVGLPMHRLSPTILGCASSFSRFSWFAHAPLITNNSWLCLIVFMFQLVCPCISYRL